MKYEFSQIYIDEAAKDDEITSRLLDSFPNISPVIIRNKDAFQEKLNRLPLNRGKCTLWITHFKGKFLKPCPGTAPSYRCCNYLVINETTNCPIDCSYCILQGYINNPAITVYTNYKKILDEMDELSRHNPDRILRVGTGELTDSLALDPLTGISEKLIRKTQALPNILLELKSKTDHIDHLIHLPSEKVVLSWSVNPEEIVQSEEHKSVNIRRRLAAAKKAGEKGFLIGLHFDPLLFFPGWEASYERLLLLIGEFINPSRVAWISLGSLRYPTPLKEIAQSRFPRSKIFSQEFISGTDGKARYPRLLRLQMYRTIFKLIRNVLGEVFVYFCMESEDMWKTVLGRTPASNNEVDWFFAQNLYQKFPELKLPEPRKSVYEKDIIL